MTLIRNFAKVVEKTQHMLQSVPDAATLKKDVKTTTGRELK